MSREKTYLSLTLKKWHMSIAKCILPYIRIVVFCWALPTDEDQGYRWTFFMAVGWNCKQNGVSLGAPNEWIRRMGTTHKKNIYATALRIYRIFGDIYAILRIYNCYGQL